MQHTQHTPRPDVTSVYHDRPRGIPWLAAFCEDGWDYHDYYPHALDDHVVRAWALQTRDDITVYLPPHPDPDDEDDDHPHGSLAGSFTTLDEAPTYCTERFGPLRIVWL